MTDSGAPGDTNGTGPSRAGWWKVALVVSLAFNLFVIGAVGARHYWWEHHRHYSHMHRAPFTQLLPRPFFYSLADSRRDELRTLMRAHRPEFFAGREHMRLAALDVAGALVAQPFDQARFDKALQGFAESGHALMDTGMKVVADVVAHLSPAERKKLGEQLMSAIAARANPPGDGRN